MSRPRPTPPFPARRAPTSSGPIRLDVLGNPFGPSLGVFDALAGADGLHLPAGGREADLRRRLALQHGVPSDRLVLADGIDALIGMVLRWRRDRGPLVLFPPHDPEDRRRAASHGVEVIELARGERFGLGLDRETLAELPPGAAALVTTPNDPTGTLLGSQDAVRLTRGCELLVADERHGEYAGRSLVPLVREFDNLVVLRTFETWAGLAGLPLAYAVAPPGFAAELNGFRRREGVPAGAVIAAMATLDDLAYVRATVARVREEKSRLVRMLRKLNMISVPHPSWANFVLARVERGDAALFAERLAQRDILVHRPDHPALRDTHLRISAGLPDHTEALKRALIEIAAEEL